MKRLRYDEYDFIEFLQDLIDANQLEGKELGITKRVIAMGYDSLTPRQKWVFDDCIEQHSIERCKSCGKLVSWSDMMYALDNGCRCEECDHREREWFGEDEDATDNGFSVNFHFLMN